MHLLACTVPTNAPEPCTSAIYDRGNRDHSSPPYESPLPTLYIRLCSKRISYTNPQLNSFTSFQLNLDSLIVLTYFYSALRLSNCHLRLLRSVCFMFHSHSVHTVKLCPVIGFILFRHAGWSWIPKIHSRADSLRALSCSIVIGLAYL